MNSQSATRDDQIIDCELRDRAHKICIEYLGGAWAEISPSVMSFTPISGGMSNQLFCCSLPDSIKPAYGEPSQALLRLYGDQSRNTDMTLQVQIFELLSSKDLGPKLYGNFDEGRLEEFLPANSLTCEELMDRDISSIIARKLATVHSLNVPNMSSTNTWILNRFHEWLSFIQDHKKSNKPTDNGTLAEPTLKIARKLLSVDFEKEIYFLKRVFDGTCSPIVFSHNDIHQGNILLARLSRRRSTLDKRIILIDFEYCSYNYRAYDIANHFCEWCFEYDTPDYPHFAIYPERFPSVETQREFIRNYLDQQRKLILNNGQVNNNNNNNKMGAENGPPFQGDEGHVKANGNYLCDNNNRGTKTKSKDYSNNNHLNHSNNNNNGTSPRNGTTLTPRAMALDDDDYEVDKILNEVRPFCMAANLVWTLWCIKSAVSSNIRFGYWEHAWNRWQFYTNFKRIYLKEMEKDHPKQRNASFIPKLNGAVAVAPRTLVDFEAKR